jgi:hypothetical protein
MRKTNRPSRKTALLAGISVPLLALTAAMASGPSSVSYSIPWDTIDGGGHLSSSAGYLLADSIAQTAPVGVSTSAGYILNAGFQTVPDEDGDELIGFVDNCIEDSNADQRDTDNDGLGNRCDADLNNDCVVNTQDLGDLKLDFFTAAANPDLNGDGVVNVVDLGIMKVAFFGPPGPSGLPNACSSP